MRALDIRNKFLSFFEQNGHKPFPSAPLVPQDPTLLFTSAGMVPFKNRFLGIEKGVPRATSVQLCMRTSDIDRVGFTKRHLTFFEMLGNFSFGDYFKEGAIDYAWKFLTEELNLPKNRLWVTVYAEDDEAERLWRRHNPTKLLRLGKDSNFWAMGPTGPCGPCSEIHWDFGEESGCGPDCNPGHDNCERFLEIWNLVFMQFDRQTDSQLVPLTKPCVDTGMGMERLACVMQGKNSVFETDLFLNEAMGSGLHLSLAEQVTNEDLTPLRIITDHLRASVFLVSQGIVPSNEGRGYILRRLIRRAMRHGKTKQPFLGALAADFANLPAFQAYQESFKNLSGIQNIIKTEEEKFLETLERGKEFIDELSRQAIQTNKRLLAGDQVFRLYETYGYPLELVTEIAKEQNLKVDLEGFERAKENAKEIARKGWKGSGAESVGPYVKLKQDLNLPDVTFTGYETLTSEAKVLALITNFSNDPLTLPRVSRTGLPAGLPSPSRVEGLNKGETAVAGQEVGIILSATPFYAESGGQVGDTGKITSPNAAAEVSATIKPIEGLILHKAKISKGTLTVGDEVAAEVDQTARAAIARHHSTAHLLHWALRKLVGNHIVQAGSYVGSDKFRLDFTHNSSLKGKALEDIEKLVNEAIKADAKRDRKEMPLEEAREAGAMTLFNEKYGEKVFVVRFGESIEACGGTHVLSTGEIGRFKILKESSVAAGVRRIEGICGEALALWEKKEAERRRGGKAERQKPKETVVLGKAQTLEGKTTNSVAYKIQVFDSGDLNALRPLCDQERKTFAGIVIQAAVLNEKMSFVLGLHTDLTDKGLDGAAIAKSLSQKLGGSAGGRKDFAQGGFGEIADPKTIKQALLYTLET
ncbi:MAG: alanine--tRNA ligase [Elusimicrobia bacterium]|nr:alanine--tRNA ligase [Elusimicrobiota bacterium]